MTEQELRALVRDAIAAQTASGAYALSHRAPSAPPAPSHPSHLLLVLPTGSDTDGPCLIEPAVMCNHCGYCKSYGH